MTDAAGIAGKIDPFGKIIAPSQTGLENRKLMFAQLRCLVDGDDVVLLTLIPQQISVAGAVTEGDGTAAGHGKSFFSFMVGENFSVFRQQRLQMIGFQFGVGAPNQQAPDAGKA